MSDDIQSLPGYPCPHPFESGDGTPTMCPECRIERLQAIVAQQAELLTECSELLWKHHSSIVTRTAPGMSCPVCSKNGTEMYPDDIFGRLEKAKKVRGE